MPVQIPKFTDILKVLAKHKVDFIVIGGVGAALQGAPIATFDLDLVHSRSRDNLERLGAALQELGAYYREHSSQRLTPEVDHLASAGHHLLMTDAGPLDLLGTVTKNRSYEELIAHTQVLPIGDGLEVRILDLETLIILKEETARAKDQAVLAILRQTLEQKKPH